VSEEEAYGTESRHALPDGSLPLDVARPRPDGLAVDVPFSVSLLALSSVRGLGVTTLRALVNQLGDDLGAVWHMDIDQLAGLLARHRISGSSRLAALITDQAQRLIDNGRIEEKDLASARVHVVAPSRVPEKLRATPGGPLWLFAEGDPTALDAAPHIAVVGTRRASSAGVKAAEAVVRTLAAYPITLVSGLAEGIDAAAHAAALRDGVRNVAFLGHGTGLVFPQETAHIRRQIADAGGCVASEYPPRERYRKQYFVQRNRLQAGLSDAVVAVEGTSGGGTAHTVRFAADFRRALVGITWPNADATASLTSLVASLPRSVAIDVFTESGRRQLDALFRSIAEQYHSTTNSLSLVARQLVRESRLRSPRQVDWVALRELIERLEGDRPVDGH
jgi:DNA protecting protein DprA